MNHWVAAFLSAISLIIAVFLVYFALSGIAYFGVTAQAEMALAVILLILAAFTGFIAFTAFRTRHSRVKTGRETFIGARGVAVTDLKPKGEVRVMGEFWQATAKGQAISKGQAVEVLDVDDIFLIVKSVEEKA